MGVAAVVGSEDDAEPLALAAGEPPADAPLADGDALCSTNVVVVSPPQPESASPAASTMNIPIPFMASTTTPAVQELRSHPRAERYG